MANGQGIGGVGFSGGVGQPSPFGAGGPSAVGFGPGALGGAGAALGGPGGNLLALLSGLAYKPGYGLGPAQFYSRLAPQATRAVETLRGLAAAPRDSQVASAGSGVNPAILGALQGLGSPSPPQGGSSRAGALQGTPPLTLGDLRGLDTKDPAVRSGLLRLFYSSAVPALGPPSAATPSVLQALGPQAGAALRARLVAQGLA